MTPHILLDASVLINPISLAVHLAAFADSTRPLGISVASLWEEFNRRYSLITLADVIPWFRDDLDRCMAQRIGVNQHAAPDATLALLIAATRLGILRPVCTESSMAYFQTDGWAGYLSSSLGDDWTVLHVEQSLFQNTWQIALLQTAHETGLSPDEISRNYEVVFRQLANQTHDEYAVADRARSLSVVLTEVFATLRAGASLSTPDPLLRDIVANNMHAAATLTPPDRLPFEPLIERVVVRTDTTTVRDILSIIELRRLSSFLGGADQLIELIEADLAARNLVKDAGLFLLGVLPVIGPIATAIEGRELLHRLWRVRSDNREPSAEHLLYWSPATITLTAAR